MDADLREVAEQARRNRESRKQPDRYGCNQPWCRAPDGAGKAVVGGHQGEGTVGAVHEAERHRPPLRLVAVEQPFRGAAPEYVGQLERQVVGVLQAGVHSLSADGRVHVPRVAGEEDAALPEAGRNAVVDPVGREPEGLREGDAKNGSQALPRE